MTVCSSELLRIRTLSRIIVIIIRTATLIVIRNLKVDLKVDLKVNLKVNLKVDLKAEVKANLKVDLDQNPNLDLEVNPKATLIPKATNIICLLTILPTNNEKRLNLHKHILTTQIVGNQNPHAYS